MVHAMHDERFLSWPPSPQLAMATFPYARAVYHNLWREFVFPLEVRLNRQIMGLPPMDPRLNNMDANNNRHGNGEIGGIMGFLQSILDALDPLDQGHGNQLRMVHEEVPADQGGEEDDMVLAVEVMVEGVDPNGVEVEEADDDEAQDDARDEPHNELQNGMLNDQNPAAAPEQQEEQEPLRPMNPRPGAGSILSSLGNGVVSALSGPVVWWAAGEVLRLLVLPRSWTAAAANPYGRPGFFQNRWGRSLVGGCVYVVLRDALRVGAKYRKAATMNYLTVTNGAGPRRR